MLPAAECYHKDWFGHIVSSVPVWNHKVTRCAHFEGRYVARSARRAASPALWTMCRGVDADRPFLCESWYCRTRAAADEVFEEFAAKMRAGEAPRE